MRARITLKDATESPATHTSSFRSARKGESWTTARPEEIAYFKGEADFLVEELDDPAPKETALLQRDAPRGKKAPKSEPSKPALLPESNDEEDEEDEEGDDELLGDLEDDEDEDGEEGDDETPPKEEKYNKDQLEALSKKQLSKILLRDLGLAHAVTARYNKSQMINAILESQS